MKPVQTARPSTQAGRVPERGEARTGVAKLRTSSIEERMSLYSSGRSEANVASSEEMLVCDNDRTGGP